MDLLGGVSRYAHWALRIPLVATAVELRALAVPPRGRDGVPGGADAGLCVPDGQGQRREGRRSHGRTTGVTGGSPRRHGAPVRIAYEPALLLPGQLTLWGPALLLVLIHPSAWKERTPNFALRGF